MPQPYAVNDHTLARLRTLAAQLNERLGEAEDLRTRFTKAREANLWPDMRLASQLLADVNRRAH